MNKELTPMQELISKLHPNFFTEEEAKYFFTEEEAKYYLEKEKQVIINSIIECDKLCMQAQDYYNQKFIKIN